MNELLNVDPSVFDMIGKFYRHRNGAEYKVLHLSNVSEDGFYRPEHPIDVIYKGYGRVYTRPLSDWDRSFTEITKEV